MTPNADAADPAVSRFLDAVWMERGLSTNTLAAYVTMVMVLLASIVGVFSWLMRRVGTQLASGA